MNRSLILAALTLNLYALAPAQDIESALTTRLNELHKEAGFPGMTASIILKDGRQIDLAIGLSDGEQNLMMRPHDRMLAGSIGKTYFAAVTLQLVGEGKLSLDEPVSKWIGDRAWFSRLPNAKDLTLRNLMTHSSGIPEHVQDPAFLAAVFKDPDKDWRPEELLTYVLDKQPLSPVGKEFSYADTNFIVVGTVVEAATGKKFYDEVERRILKPLGLNETSPSTSRKLAGLVQGYGMPNGPFGAGGPMIKDGQFVFNPQMEWTGGGFVTTSRDLAKWARALYAGDVLSKPMQEEMRKAVPANTGRGDEYGLGMQVRHTPYGITYGHGGWFPGYVSEVEHFADHGLTIAVQFNTDEGRKLRRRTHGYVVEIAKAVLGTP